MAFLNLKLWRTSYLLEFCKNGIPTDAFAFSVPVQSEEINYPQRISDTKTFGGAVVEDYGNDLPTITLNGSTINEDVKIIYKGSLGFGFMTGTQEIFYLQKLIEKYGKNQNLKNKSIKLYQLTGNLLSSKDANKSWQIFITNFQIKRSKEKPFSYDYTLQAKCKNLERKKKLNLSLIDKLANLVNKLEKLKTLWNMIKLGIATIVDGIETIANFIAEISDLISNIDIVINELTSLVTDPIKALSSVIEESTNLLNVTEENILKITPKYVATNILAATNELISVTDNFVTECKDFSLSRKYDQIAANYTTEKTLLRDNFNLLVDKIKNEVEETVVAVNQVVGSTNVCVQPGASDTDDTVLSAYGFKKLKVSQSDTWEKISFKIFGTAEYASTLALFNGKSELVVGDTIIIPILESNNDTIEGNEVVRTYGKYDNAGVDIGIVDNDLDVKNGDLNIVENADNLNQSISSRLSTVINNRVRSIVYGIRTNIGEEKDVSNVYVSESIKETILADPRIESIESIDWEGLNDKLQITVTYITKEGIKSVYNGVVE